MQSKTWVVMLLTAVILLAACNGPAPGETAEPAPEVTEASQLVIVSLGDSYASGEGNPDVPAAAGGPKWQLTPEIDAERCHRSTENSHFLAATSIADEWSDGSVIFRSFACSGASIDYGILDGQFRHLEECEDGSAGLVYCDAGQLDRAEAFKNQNNIFDIDVVLISIGGNDLGFATVIEACIRPPYAGSLYKFSCDQQPFLNEMVQNGCEEGTINPFCFSDPSDDDADGDLVHKPQIGGLHTLPDRLDDMLEKVQQRLDPDHIILVGYPDPTRDENGSFCHKWSDGFVVGVDVMTLEQQPWGTSLPIWPFKLPVGASAAQVEAKESMWTYEYILEPLNETLAEAASDAGVEFLGGMAELTHRHGICAEKTVEAGVVNGDTWYSILPDRWFLSLKDSHEVQADLFGALHPNLAGHKAISKPIAAKMKGLLGL